MIRTEVRLNQVQTLRLPMILSFTSREDLNWAEEAGLGERVPRFRRDVQVVDAIM